MSSFHLFAGFLNVTPELMCTVQIESHSFVCQTEDKVFLLEKTNLNSWKPVKPISPPAKPLDKEVINKKAFQKPLRKI